MFGSLYLNDDPPGVPAHSTLGCAYGRCAFCKLFQDETGTQEKLDLTVAVMSVDNRAEPGCVNFALKDS
jgi:hypothetical protein